MPRLGYARSRLRITGQVVTLDDSDPGKPIGQHARREQPRHAGANDDRVVMLWCRVMVHGVILPLQSMARA